MVGKPWMGIISESEKILATEIMFLQSLLKELGKGSKYGSAVIADRIGKRIKELESRWGK